MSEAAPLPSEEQKQPAKWDLLLADLEHRQEQIRNTRTDTRLKPWQVAFAGMTAGAALFAAGAAFIKLLGG
jgi:hypothetical protein